MGVDAVSVRFWRYDAVALAGLGFLSLREEFRA